MILNRRVELDPSRAKFCTFLAPDRRRRPRDAAAGVRFSPIWGKTEKWHGAPAVLFPLRDEHGAAIAVQGRMIDPQHGPKAITRGPVRLALFSTPDALEAPTFAITEAPIDALSLAAAGLPAVALCGTTPPAWLRRRVLSRTVLIATDRDEAGESAATSLTTILSSFDARVERLSPPAGCKDWNDALTRSGPEALGDVLPVPWDPACDDARDRAELLSDPMAATRPADTLAWRWLFRSRYDSHGPQDEVLHILRTIRLGGAMIDHSTSGARLIPCPELEPEWPMLRAEWLIPHALALGRLLRDLPSELVQSARVPAA